MICYQKLRRIPNLFSIHPTNVHLRTYLQAIGLVLAFVSVAGFNVASAAPVTFGFEGSVRLITVILGHPTPGTLTGHPFTVGDTFTGTYTFESTQLDSDPDPTRGLYRIQDFELDFSNGYSITSDDGVVRVLNDWGSGVIDNYMVQIGAGSITAPVLTLFHSVDTTDSGTFAPQTHQAIFRDESATVFDSDSLPLVPPSLAAFGSRLYNWTIQSHDFDNATGFVGIRLRLEWASLIVNEPLNEPPIAVAGDNQSIHVGQTVDLDGSGSNDVETLTEDLIYDWSFDSVPAGSASAFDLTNPIEPTFVADLPGDYEIGLVVTDEGDLSSDPDDPLSQLTVSSENTPPTADAGSDQGTYVGNTVFLDGSDSSDPDSQDSIASYDWTFFSQPAGSTAVLSDANTDMPSYVPDVDGTYVARLIVSDGHADSAPDDVTIAVVTTESFAEVQTVASLNAVVDLSATSVTSSGNQTALGNILLQVIESLQDDPPDLDKAIKKLEDAIERTDGCALRGTPDVKGGGKSPKIDTINNCTDQAVVYPMLVDALDALTP